MGFAMQVYPNRSSRRMITVRELSEKLSRSVSSIWADVAAGRLAKGIKVHGSTRWDEREIDAWLDDLLADRDKNEAASADGEAA
jgi:predicted DNA-binding transcriptional regulator AlpA